MKFRPPRSIMILSLSPEDHSAGPSLQQSFCSTGCWVLSHHIPAWRNTMWHFPLLKAFDLIEVWLCISRCVQGIFHFHQKVSQNQSWAAVWLTAKNRLKQYLIKVIFEVLTYRFTAIGVLGRSNSPSGEFSFRDEHRCYAVLQLLVLSVLHDNHLRIVPDSWCNFSKILHMWRTATRSGLS